jgi:preprotein translocase subunit SecG
MNMGTDLMVAAGWMGFLRGTVIVVFLLSCVLLMGVILIQKGRGGGIGSAFGGTMSASPFGTKTGDVFTWITVVLAGLFLLCALLLNVLVGKENATTGVQETPVVAPENPATKPSPTPTASTQPDKATGLAPASQSDAGATTKPAGK